MSHTSHSRGRGAGVRLRLLAALTLPLLAAFARDALAVPSFARQTGQDCVACHVGGFGPQLTPYGVKFKLGGFTDSDGKDNKIPLSAMAVGGLTHTAKAQEEAPTDRTGTNNNLVLDQASIFLAGRASEYIGAFMQGTYTGADNKFAMDNADARAVRTLELDGTDLTFGLSLHNTPGMQDPFNTLPVWRFPYVGSSVAPGPAAAPIFDGGLEQHVTGLSAYTFADEHFYAELGSYRSLSPAALDSLGLGRDSYPGKLGSSTSYWRVAFFDDLKKSAFSLGAFGFNAALDPSGDGSSNSDHYRDLGLDAHYQFLGTREHIGTLNASYIREHQGLDASAAAGNADSANGRLNELNLNASYTYDQTWGLTLGRFVIQGSRDAALYADSANGSPDSAGWVLQTDWTPWGKEGSWGSPWANLRVGLQYTAYDRFDGAKHNYDGAGHDASDNNTIYAFIWTSF